MCRKRIEQRHRYEEEVFTIYDPPNDVDIDDHNNDKFIEATVVDSQNEMYHSQDEKVENMDYDAFLNYKYISCIFSEQMKHTVLGF